MRAPAWAAPIVLGAARVTLGVLWLNEGITKYRAHFGAPDVLLVAGNADTSSRVPGYFRVFSDATLKQAPHLFGLVIPLLETSLGVALVLGVLTWLTAAGSLFQLLTYWCADQLIDQYPAMALLSAVLMLWPATAGRISVKALWRARGGRIKIA